MARPTKWRSPTRAIRIPAHLADQLMEIAHLLDEQTHHPEQPIAETVQPIAEISYQSPARLISIYEGQMESAYILPPISLSADDDAVVDALLEQFCTELGEKEMALLLARLAKEWLIAV